MDFKNLPEEIVWSGSVVASIIGLAIITKIINMKPQISHSSEIINTIKNLINQSISWHKQSQQDSDPLFAFKHSNYAMSYINAARDIVSDSMIQKTTGIDVHETLKLLEGYQQSLSKRITKSCPIVNPKSKSSSVSWM